ALGVHAATTRRLRVVDDVVLQLHRRVRAADGHAVTADLGGDRAPVAGQRDGVVIQLRVRADNAGYEDAGHDVGRSRWRGDARDHVVDDGVRAARVAGNGDASGREAGGAGGGHAVDYVARDQSVGHAARGHVRRGDVLD